jgi:subtilase family serine protease
VRYFLTDKRIGLPVFVPLALLILVVGFFPAVAVAQTAARSAGSTSNLGVKPLVSLPSVKFAGVSITPPTDAQCRADDGFPCYSPQEMRNAYDVTPLINAGDTGKGQSIVIIDSYGSPTIQSDLHTFDQGYGLPDPPSFKILSPLGSVPYDPNNSTMVNWAFETTLDVEWSHAMAPDASIVLMTSPVAETQGVTGLTQFLYLEQYAVHQNLGQIISQSWAAT